MDVSEDSLMIRVAREIKRILRRNRDIRFEATQLAELVVREPMIYREACLWGDGLFYRKDDDSVVTLPDMELVKSWVQHAIRKFCDRANKFQKWIRRNYYVTKWRMDDGGYYLPYQFSHGPGGQC
jgi:hypothetical protein